MGKLRAPTPEFITSATEKLIRLLSVSDTRDQAANGVEKS